MSLMANAGISGNVGDISPERGGLRCFFVTWVLTYMNRIHLSSDIWPYDNYDVHHVHPVSTLKTMENRNFLSQALQLPEILGAAQREELVLDFTGLEMAIFWNLSKDDMYCMYINVYRNMKTIDIYTYMTYVLYVYRYSIYELLELYIWQVRFVWYTSIYIAPPGSVALQDASAAAIARGLAAAAGGAALRRLEISCRWCPEISASEGIYWCGRYVPIVVDI